MQSILGGSEEILAEQIYKGSIGWQLSPSKPKTAERSKKWDQGKKTTRTQEEPPRPAVFTGKQMTAVTTQVEINPPTPQGATGARNTRRASNQGVPMGVAPEHKGVKGATDASSMAPH